MDTLKPTGFVAVIFHKQKITKWWCANLALGSQRKWTYKNSSTGSASWWLLCLAFSRDVTQLLLTNLANFWSGSPQTWVRRPAMLSWATGVRSRQNSYRRFKQANSSQTDVCYKFSSWDLLNDRPRLVQSKITCTKANQLKESRTKRLMQALRRQCKGATKYILHSSITL